MKNDNINYKNCDVNSKKILSNKTKRNNKKNYPKSGEKWKPYKYMTYEEKKRLADRESFKDHLKQVKLFVLTLFFKEIRNNPKILKNLDFDRKSIKNIIKPATPHNTSQFLSTNFCMGRNENIPKSLILVDPLGYTYNTCEDITSDAIDETDDYCIPGGSMTGKFLKII
jgi:hypothetical protein